MFTTLINWFIGLWTAIKNIWQLVWNFIRQIFMCERSSALAVALNLIVIPIRATQLTLL